MALYASGRADDDGRTVARTYYTSRARPGGFRGGRAQRAHIMRVKLLVIPRRRRRTIIRHITPAALYATLPPAPESHIRSAITIARGRETYGQLYYICEYVFILRLKLVFTIYVEI